MSARTHANQRNKPGAASTNKPDRFSRRVEHKRVRRKAHMMLTKLVEPDDLSLPVPVHTSVDVDPADKPETQVKRKRFKVWKTKSWKRRSKLRSIRTSKINEQYADI